jgi:hypothetical protein
VFKAFKDICAAVLREAVAAMEVPPTVARCCVRPLRSYSPTLIEP